MGWDDDHHRETMYAVATVGRASALRLATLFEIGYTTTTGLRVLNP